MWAFLDLESLLGFLQKWFEEDIKWFPPTKLTFEMTTSILYLALNICFKFQFWLLSSQKTFDLKKQNKIR